MEDNGHDIPTGTESDRPKTVERASVDTEPGTKENDPAHIKTRWSFHKATGEWRRLAAMNLENHGFEHPGRDYYELEVTDLIATNPPLTEQTITSPKKADADIQRAASAPDQTPEESLEVASGILTDETIEKRRNRRILAEVMRHGQGIKVIRSDCKLPDDVESRLRTASVARGLRLLVHSEIAPELEQSLSAGNPPYTIHDVSGLEGVARLATLDPASHGCDENDEQILLVLAATESANEHEQADAPLAEAA